MKWEIKDEWIHARKDQSAVSLLFIREWNRQYWNKAITLLVGHTGINNMKKMITSAFNTMNDNKTFRNCVLFHSKAFLEFNEVPAFYENNLILAHPGLKCNECNKKISTSTMVYIHKTHLSTWNPYDKMRFYCSKCFNIKRKIEKLRE